MSSALLTESVFQGRIVDLAKLCGWRIHAERPAQRREGRWTTPIQGHVGFPDLVLVRRERLIFAELKVGYRKATDEQMIWLIALASRAETHLWYPKDWERIQQILR